ncbi:putative phytoene dehydrogenase [Oceaniovalibus guishaninsula JLT2003]|uniref:Putative phytoene dehydrogenase n=1 Tax=Oceaniovalibus guishaninsula JLT2003 TaxID=1231392 RepID=K2HLN4_9RHOB|nr:hydroxysqualene dehydroxylase HpnE [Oceaniovalibus guishaninsula]EKE43819.1 putative phytoene dehydrogenase [Oceaniovalibus guishaninsula JLT2003]
MRHAHVIGAGLAGLVAAEDLSSDGFAVTIYEASPKAGGRCRSFPDARLGRVIDNGNHLILSGNSAVLDWADRIGGAHLLETGDAAYPFLDLLTGTGWTIRPGAGPFGILSRAARPPGIGAAAMARDIARLTAARRGRSVADTLPLGPAWRRFWDPMTRAVLNEPPETASAALLRAALLRSFARGRAAARPVFAPSGLGTALVDPALARLAARGVDLRLRCPVQTLDTGRTLRAIHTADGTRVLRSGDVAILAVPPRQMAALLPGTPGPRSGRTILNAHFRTGPSGLPPLLALVGADAHWLFRRGDVVSVTVSASEASPLDGLPRDAALSRLWGDVRAAAAHHGTDLPQTTPPARLVRERAATFDQSPQGVGLRRAARTSWPNLFLAGDHVATGLPATLEGAVRSGLAAARLARLARD